MARSAFAVVAGLVFIFATHLGADELMHGLGVFPPSNQPMYAPGLNLLALGYRSVLSVLGCAVTAWLAPRAAVAHAEALGFIGVVLSGLGAYAASTANLGPLWYPLALMVVAMPCAWAGAWIARRMGHQ